MVRARSMRTGVTSVPNARQHAGVDGEDRPGRLQQLGHAAGVDRAGAAERQHGDAAQVVALLDRVHARRGGHVLVDELVDAGGGVADRQAELSATDRRAAASAGEVERHVAAEEVSGVEQPEHQVGVGDGGLGAAAAVAGRAGVGAGRLGADLQQTEVVDRAPGCRRRRRSRRGRPTAPTPGSRSPS